MMPRLLYILKSPLRNKGVKLMAILMAIISWYAIRGAISNKDPINNIPLVVRLQSGWAVLEQSTDVVDVLFQGANDDLRRLSRDNISVVLDLRGREHIGSMEFRLEPSMIHAPGSARPLAIQPGEVIVKLDRQATRQVPVKVDIQGDLPEGMEMEKVEADPASVQVTGPKQQVDNLHWVRSVPVPVQGRRQTFRERVPLMQPGETWKAQIDPPRINARVILREQSEDRELKGLPITAMVNPLLEGVSIIISPVTADVIAKGSADKLSRIEKSAIHPYIDCSTLTPGARYELPVRVNLPDGVGLGGVDPKSVSVTISLN